ncbi:hypothetical protein TSUD_327690 [Trifolium subterraneum]|uniref:Uncharacterized protein n=1 Tax=Trifolium subterraneum TaxID=3900 RepID=A0A2Z6M035_TRISU|nr:hypothetical protein TSUD_327690 [Trifolium subterraneum]
MATIPEINPDDIPKKVKAVKDNAVKDKAKTVKKKTAMVQPGKRRQNAGEESLTQEASAMGNESKLGTCFRAMKSWNKILK